MIDAARLLSKDYLIAKHEIIREQPKYRLLLRSLGAYFDQQQARYITLAEVEDGFIWHFFPPMDLVHPIHGTITHADLPDFVESMKQARIEQVAANTPLPKRSLLSRKAPPSVRYSAGYEDVFRTLSGKFDMDCVSNILLTEGDYGWLISYCLPVPMYVQADARRMNQFNYFHESLCSHEEMDQWIEAAREYRGKHDSILPF